MATVTLLSNGGHKSCDDMNKVLAYVMREAKTSYDGKKLVTGINCPADTAYTNMMLTKNYHRKTDGRMYYHLVQSFSPDEKITPELAHKVAVEFAEKQFPGYEVVVGTHVDREHIHSHIVFNSVSLDGKKYHSDRNDIQRWRSTSDEVCRKYALSIVTPLLKSGMKQPGTREFRAISKQNSWKLELVVMIEEAMRRAKSREEFIRFMEEHGYKVTWTDSRKYITYTTPTGMKCRDNKLHETKFLKEVLENEFRIRESIRRSQSRSEEESDYSIEDNTMRYGNRSKLECTVEGNSQGTGVDGQGSNERTDAQLRQSTQSDIHDRSSLAGRKGAVNIERYAAEGIFPDGEIGITGWEDERAECFGLRESEEGITGTDAGLLGSYVSQDTSSLPDPNAFSLGARLIANALTSIDTNPNKREEHKRAPRRERKNYQKREEQGPTMTL